MPIVSLQDKKDFNIEEGSILFEALEKQSYELPHGCLSGSCGACKVEILEGEEHLSQASFIEENTINSIKNNPLYSQKKIRLSCRVKINGDCTIKEIKG